MRSRRKRKKQQGVEETAEANSSLYESGFPASEQPSSDVKTPSPEDELNIELDDSFEIDLASTSNMKGSSPALVSTWKKTETRARKIITNIPQNKEKQVEEDSDDDIQPESKRPIKMRRSARTTHKAVEDELESLDDDSILPHLSSNIDPIEPSPEVTTETAEIELPSETIEITALEEPLSDTSSQEAKSNEDSPAAMPTTAPASDWKGLLKAKLQSLALIEQISIGLIALILAIVAIWSSNILSANIPDTIVASKLKYPLQGDAVSIASFESYWRRPIREGEKIDEGVSDAINVIPEIKIALTSSSKAKALRFLFRDEEGRLVGDATTIQTSGGKFLPTRSVTVSTDGTTATIHSTAGFRFAGELISYLADDDFQWEAVILESQDGQKYKEFIAIPISPNRKN